MQLVRIILEGPFYLSSSAFILLFYLLVTFLILALLALLHVSVVPYQVQYRNLRSDFNR